jgi:hypothetical protein
MHEVSQRWALTLAIIASVVGVVALVLGAVLAPIPTHPDASQFVTSLAIRGFLALAALVTAFILAYYGGFRIQNAFEAPPPGASPAVAAGSPLLALFVTPGPRRDAVYAGAIVIAAYWVITTLYITALGNVIGQMGVTPSTLPSFVAERTALGLAAVLAGAGAGGLGARNALTRRLTRRVFAAQTVSAFSPASLPAQPTSESANLPADNQEA